MTRARYNGTSRKILLAFDVGTTFSGVSYSVLDPGEVPVIRTVTRYPSQDQVGGDSKIPTIVYYDREGAVRAVGAEAVREGIEGIAEDEGWTKAEWFKLHLRPRHRTSSEENDRIPPLPPNKTVQQVFADFLRYLFECTKTYIQDTHAFGESLWGSAGSQIDFVLTHPNGWEGPQQILMRKAAVMAGLVPDTDEGQARISFVTEGEASLHYCIQNGLTTEAMKNGAGVLIVDAGGGTIDISAYCQAANKSFEEIATPECHFQGSIFVTSRARLFLEGLLRGSRFYDDVDFITRRFDKRTKLGFRNETEPQFIQFTSARARDVSLNILSGQLKLAGSDVAKFFEPSVSCIIKAVEKQRSASLTVISSIFLVGGFAASDWLFLKLKESLEPKGIKICRPDTHVNKAVADGAASYYLDHFVGTRMSKMAYGTPCSIPFIPFFPAHRQRMGSVYSSFSGERRIRGVFDSILPANTQVLEEKEFRSSYYRESQSRHQLAEVSIDVHCYRGEDRNPEWMDTDSGNYSVLCEIEAKTAQLAASLTPQQAAGGNGVYFRMEFDVVLLFGLTELKAQVCWRENGVEQRGPAKIVYEPAST